MLACSLSYLACAFMGAGMSWYYFWRTMAGLGMGIVCLVLTLLSWRQWTVDAPVYVNATNADEQSKPLPVDRRVALVLILAAYTLNAIGYLPHTLFWVDYIVRELKMPLTTGGFFWAVFGFGAAIGPYIDRQPW